MKKLLPLFILFWGITYFSFGNNLIPEKAETTPIEATTTSSSTINFSGENPRSLNRPLNRIGVTMQFGPGFESHELFEMTDGRDATLSFGGGFGIGFLYGHEVGKSFDLSLEMTFKNSSLTPVLQNAEASFSRMSFSFTPAYIIPLNGGERARIKLGLGPDFYISNIFTIKGSKVVDGFDDEFTYKSTLGFHLNAILEANITERWTIVLGMEWYNVSYEYENSLNGRRSPTSSGGLKNPSGSGFDLIMGLNYHF